MRRPEPLPLSVVYRLDTTQRRLREPPAVESLTQVYDRRRILELAVVPPARVVPIRAMTAIPFGWWSVSPLRRPEYSGIQRPGWVVCQ